MGLTLLGQKELALLAHLGEESPVLLELVRLPKLRALLKSLAFRPLQRHLLSHHGLLLLSFAAPTFSTASTEGLPLDLALQYLLPQLTRWCRVVAHSKDRDCNRENQKNARVLVRECQSTDEGREHSSVEVPRVEGVYRAEQDGSGEEIGEPEHIRLHLQKTNMTKIFGEQDHLHAQRSRAHTYTFWCARGSTE